MRNLLTTTGASPPSTTADVTAVYESLQISIQRLRDEVSNLRDRVFVYYRLLLLHIQSRTYIHSMFRMSGKLENPKARWRVSDRITCGQNLNWFPRGSQN